MTLTLEEYRRRDFRSKCAQCGSWMRRKPSRMTLATRRPSPRADLCARCPIPDWEKATRA